MAGQSLTSYLKSLKTIETELQSDAGNLKTIENAETWICDPPISEGYDYLFNNYIPTVVKILLARKNFSDQAVSAVEKLLTTAAIYCGDKLFIQRVDGDGLLSTLSALLDSNQYFYNKFGFENKPNSSIPPKHAEFLKSLFTGNFVYYKQDSGSVEFVEVAAINGKDITLQFYTVVKTLVVNIDKDWNRILPQDYESNPTVSQTSNSDEFFEIVETPSAENEWKLLLDIGDLVDFRDKNGKWLMACVLDKFVVPIEQSPDDSMTISENETRVDDIFLRITILGCPEKDDEWIHIYNNRIAPCASKSNKQRGDNPIREEVAFFLKPIYDSANEEKARHAVYRRSSLVSPLYVRILQLFLERNLLEELLQLGPDTQNVVKALKLFVAIVPTLTHLSRRTLSDHGNQIIRSWVQVFMNVETLKKREVTVPLLEMTVKSFEIATSICVEKVQRSKFDWALQRLAIYLLQAPLLNKRALGLKVLNDLVKRALNIREYPNGFIKRYREPEKPKTPEGTTPPEVGVISKLPIVSYKIVPIAYLDIEKLCNLISTSSIFQECFQGENAHEALMTRSTDILKAMIKYFSVPFETISMIFDTGYEKKVPEAFVVLEELIKVMDINGISCLFQHISKQELGVPILDIYFAMLARIKENIHCTDIPFVKMDGTLQNSLQDILNIILVILAEYDTKSQLYINCESKISKIFELSNCEGFTLTSISYSNHLDCFQAFVDTLFLRLKNLHRCGLYTKLLSSFVTSWPESIQDKELFNFERKVIASYLNEKYAVVKTYCDIVVGLKANELKLHTTMSRQRDILDSIQNYCRELRVVFDFLFVFAQSSNSIVFNREFLDSIWKATVLESISSEEVDVIMQFLKKVANFNTIYRQLHALISPDEFKSDSRTGLISDEDISLLFSQCFCVNSFLSSKHFTSIAFSCLERLFIYTNVVFGNISEYPDVSKTITPPTTSNASNTGSNYLQNNFNITILKPLEELNNWKVFTQLTVLSCDEIVAKASLRFLFSLPRKFSSELSKVEVYAKNITTFRKLILNQVVDDLMETITEINRMDDELKSADNFSDNFENRIKRCLLTVESCLNEAAFDSRFKITRHISSKNAGGNITFKCSFPKSYNIPENQTTFTIPRHLCMFDVMKQVSRICDRSPANLRILFKGNEVKLDDRKKMISEYSNLFSNETLTITDRVNSTVSDIDFSIDTAALHIPDSDLPAHMLASHNELLPLVFSLLDSGSLGGVEESLWKLVTVLLPTHPAMLESWVQLASDDVKESDIMVILKNNVKKHRTFAKSFGGSNSDGNQSNKRSKLNESEVGLENSDISIYKILYNLQIIDNLFSASNRSESDSSCQYVEKPVAVTFASRFLSGHGFEALSFILDRAKSEVENRVRGGVTNAYRDFILVDICEICSKIIRGIYLRKVYADLQNDVSSSFSATGCKILKMLSEIKGSSDSIDDISMLPLVETKSVETEGVPIIANMNPFANELESNFIGPMPMPSMQDQIEVPSESSVIATTSSQENTDNSNVSSALKTEQKVVIDSEFGASIPTEQLLNLCIDANQTELLWYNLWRLVSSASSWNQMSTIFKGSVAISSNMQKRFLRIFENVFVIINTMLGYNSELIQKLMVPESFDLKWFFNSTILFSIRNVTNDKDRAFSFKETLQAKITSLVTDSFARVFDTLSIAESSNSIRFGPKFNTLVLNSLVDLRPILVDESGSRSSTDVNNPQEKEYRNLIKLLGSILRNETSNFEFIRGTAMMIYKELNETWNSVSHPGDSNSSHVIYMDNLSSVMSIFQLILTQSVFKERLLKEFCEFGLVDFMVQNCLGMYHRKVLVDTFTGRPCCLFEYLRNYESTSSSKSSVSPSVSFCDACYQILLEIAYISDTDVLITFISYLHNVHNSLADPSRSSIDASSELKCEGGYVGLKNMGATCYMNSIMQVLFSIPDLRKNILGLPLFVNDYSSEEEANSNCLIQLQRLFLNLSYSDMKFFDPVQWVDCNNCVMKNEMNVRQQQDILEYLQVLCDKMNEFMSTQARMFDEKYRGFVTEFDSSNESVGQRLYRKNLFQESFSGKLLTQRFKVVKGTNNIESILPTSMEQYKEMLAGDLVRENEQEFISLSLNVKGVSSFEDSMVQFVGGETINDYLWHDTERVDVFSRQCVSSLPKVVLFTLQRFQFCNETLQTVKVNDYFSFPFEVDLSPLTAEGVLKGRNHNKNADMTSNLSDHSNLYELTAIVVHMGSLESGHYFALLKMDATCPMRDDVKCKNTQWVEFNDSLMRPFDISNIVDECFGSKQGSANTTTKNAYMLVYRRKDSQQTFEEMKTEVAQICKDLNADAMNVIPDKDDQDGEYVIVSNEGIEEVANQVNEKSTMVEESLASIQIENNEAVKAATVELPMDVPKIIDTIQNNKGVEMVSDVFKRSILENNTFQGLTSLVFSKSHLEYYRKLIDFMTSEFEKVLLESDNRSFVEFNRKISKIQYFESWNMQDLELADPSNQYVLYFNNFVYFATLDVLRLFSRAAYVSECTAIVNSVCKITQLLSELSKRVYSSEYKTQITVVKAEQIMDLDDADTDELQRAIELSQQNGANISSNDVEVELVEADGGENNPTEESKVSDNTIDNSLTSAPCKLTIKNIQGEVSETFQSLGRYLYYQHPARILVAAMLSKSEQLFFFNIYHNDKVIRGKAETLLMNIYESCVSFEFPGNSLETIRRQGYFPISRVQINEELKKDHFQLVYQPEIGRPLETIREFRNDEEELQYALKLSQLDANSSISMVTEVVANEPTQDNNNAINCKKFFVEDVMNMLSQSESTFATDISTRCRSDALVFHFLNFLSSNNTILKIVDNHRRCDAFTKLMYSIVSMNTTCSFARWVFWQRDLLPQYVDIVLGDSSPSSNVIYSPRDRKRIPNSNTPEYVYYINKNKDLSANAKNLPDWKYVMLTLLNLTAGAWREEFSIDLFSMSLQKISTNQWNNQLLMSLMSRNVTYIPVLKEILLFDEKDVHTNKGAEVIYGSFMGARPENLWTSFDLIHAYLGIMDKFTNDRCTLLFRQKDNLIQIITNQLENQSRANYLCIAIWSLMELILVNGNARATLCSNLVTIRTWAPQFLRFAHRFTAKQEKVASNATYYIEVFGASELLFDSTWAAKASCTWEAILRVLQMARANVDELIPDDTFEEVPEEIAQYNAADVEAIDYMEFDLD